MAALDVEVEDHKAFTNGSEVNMDGPAESEGIEPGDAHLVDDLAKARHDLREIDDSIRTLTGRSPMELVRFGRGGFRGRGRGRVFDRGFEAPGFRNSVQDARIEGVKRKFTAITGPDEEDFDDRKRIRGPAFAVVRSRDTGGEGSLGNRRPVIASSVMAAPKETKSRSVAIEEIKENERKDTQQRNRRMFQNVLVGTLTKFREEESRFKDQERKQQEIEKKLEEQKRQELDKLNQDKRELLNKRREQQREVRRLQRKVMITDMSKEWETHMKRLENFIQTQAKPPVFYLPAKHTMRTIELQKKSVKRIEELRRCRLELIAHHQERVQRDLAAMDMRDQEQDRLRIERFSGTKATVRGKDRREHESEEESSDEEDKAGSGAEEGAIGDKHTIERAPGAEDQDWDMPAALENSHKDKQGEGEPEALTEPRVEQPLELAELNTEQPELNFEEA